MASTTTTDAEQQMTDSTNVENEKKRPREDDVMQDAPDEKRQRLTVDTTNNTTPAQPAPQTSTPVSAPKNRLALLERLKSKVTQIDNVIKEVPIPQPVQTSPAPTQKVQQKNTPPSNKKNPKPKKARNKDSDEYNPASDEDDAEMDRPRRQRKPNKYTDGDDESDKDPMRRALHLLRTMKTHRWSWPFLTPVDPVALGIPDYLNIVKKPMDLGTVEQKLMNNEYADIFAFSDDVNLIWGNCFLYNQPQSDVVKMAESLKKLFDEKFKRLTEDVLNPTFDAVQSEYIPPAPKTSAPANPPKPKAPPKKRTKKTPPVDAREMNFDEKKVLSENIEKLDTEQMVKIVQIIQQRAPKASSQANEQEIEIDLDKLDAVTLRQLEKYVHTCLNKKKPKKKKSSSKQVSTPVQHTSLPTAPAPTSAPAPAKEESESSDTEESSDDSSDESSSDDDDDKKPSAPSTDASGPQSLAAQAVA